MILFTYFPKRGLWILSFGNNIFTKCEKGMDELPGGCDQLECSNRQRKQLQPGTCSEQEDLLSAKAVQENQNQDQQPEMRVNRHCLSHVYLAERIQCRAFMTPHGFH